MLLDVLENLDRGSIWAGQPLLDPSERRLEAVTVYGAFAGVIAIPMFVVVSIVLVVAGLHSPFVKAIPAAVAIAIVIAAVIYLLAPRFGLGGFETVDLDPYFVMRLEGLLDGLGAVVGIEEVRFAAVASEDVNVGSFFQGKSHPFIVFTSVSQDIFSRVELEAVVARELVRIKTGAALFDTRLAVLRRMVMLVTGGALPRSLSRHSAERVAIADVTGVSVTRYPPALAQILERYGRPATPSVHTPRYLKFSASAWLFPGLSGSDLEARVRELRSL